jgi:hypothetical protein
MATAEDSSFDIAAALPRSSSTSPPIPIIKMREGLLKKLVSPTKHYREHHLIHRPDMDRAYSRFYDCVL